MRNGPIQMSRGGLAVFLGFVLAGCVTDKVDTARDAFYRGRFSVAEQNLADLPEDGKDSVMYLMERGMVRQARRNYRDSTLDWRKAADRINYLFTRSASKTAASFVVNDKTMDFRGAPFERTMVHAFLAKNSLVQGRWEDAGVAARNIIKDVEDLGGFPDSAYCRYIAGLALELMYDPSNASLQYRYASNILTNMGLMVNDKNGRIFPAGASARETDRRSSDRAELVCFVLIGRSPTGASSVNGAFVPPGVPYAEIMANGRTLGRSYSLSCCAQLIQATKDKVAALQLAKDVSRIVVKETISHQLKKENEALGALAEILLFALESPDDRRWETLPMWFEVARVPCPADLSSFEVVFKNANGAPTRTVTVTEMARRDRIFVSFCRDLPPEIFPEQPSTERTPPPAPTPPSAPKTPPAPKPPQLQKN